MRSFLIIALLLVTISISTLHAQSTNASLTGRITDPSKALIVGARITAISAGTGLRYEARSNGAGEYHLANLPPGPYRMEVEKPGFNKLVKPNVLVHLQDTLEINFELKVGSASEAVTVEGGAP